jgi:hypothetical protein
MEGQSGWKGRDTDDYTSAVSVSLSKEELEQTAEKFRADLGLSHDEPLDSFRIEAEGVQVIPVGKTNFLETRIVSQLRGTPVANDVSLSGSSGSYRSSCNSLSQWADWFGWRVCNVRNQSHARFGCPRVVCISAVPVAR